MTNIEDDEIERKLIEFYKQIGNNVKKARNLRNMTQLELAERLNFNAVSSISNAEVFYNNTHFSIGQLYKISLILDIDIKFLIDKNEMQTFKK